ncbi:MAG: nucleotidyltransferase [Pseudoruegeria sp.]
MNKIFRTSLNDTAIQRRAQVFTILEEICQDLEWTASQFERARSSYEAVAEWLAGSSDPLLASFDVYLHGSGALGTSIKPIGRDEFDVDLISFISGLGPEVAPGQLKATVGARLREHAYYTSILEEKKRCWRLDYAGAFNLDISPTIANPHCFNGGELVPDRKMRTWHATNPRAYRVLFDKRAKMIPRMTQSIIAMQKDPASVEPFPIRQSVKGMLRRTVQLLKLHRDQHFLEIAEEVAPISVIITTLAMKSYEMCVQRHVFADELEVLVDTIRLMPLFIERPLEGGRQIYAVWNETTGREFC